jgi:hypothetical protein
MGMRKDRSEESARNGPLHVSCSLKARGDNDRSERTGVVLALVACAVVGDGAATPFVSDRPSAQRDGSVVGQMRPTFGRKRREMSHILSFRA